MTKNYAIKIQGSPVYVSDVDAETPLPTTTAPMAVPPSCIVHSVKFSATEQKQFIFLDYANAVATAIRNFMPVRIEVVETWKVK